MRGGLVAQLCSIKLAIVAALTLGGLWRAVACSLAVLRTLNMCHFISGASVAIMGDGVPAHLVARSIKRSQPCECSFGAGSATAPVPIASEV